MPLKRTPPPTAASPTRSESEPDLAGNRSSQEQHATVHSRQKRVREEVSLIEFMDDIRSTLNKFREDQDRKLDILQKSIAEMKQRQEEKLDSLQGIIAEIRGQNDNIQSSIEFLSEQNIELKQRVSRIEAENGDNIAYIRTLEDKIEALEQKSRFSSIEIRNIPISKAETKADLLNIFTSLSSVLNAGASTSDIHDIYRISTKDKSNKPIVCKLSSVLMKEKILTCYKNFNKTHKENRLNTEHLHLRCELHKQIYLSDNLSPKMKRLHFLARDFASSNSYSFCWVAHGHIYLRKKEGDKTIRINEESDLNKLRETE
ncbi:unnamed protein product [Chilo suppressalis]|uniref:FP protein C-terminal domain-containing protein n=1 Tax=Chilo suppressalis TaxID=168631 RepID=A0ABN8ARQ4_CHISP|nr:unnamed protein product [Chilo suppressalis]